ncbi:MAG: DUF4147 domain-containing protein [Gammaproteobacteria bacterium]
MSRRRLLEILETGLAAVDGETCTARSVAAGGGTGIFDLIAIGKSACAMTRGLLRIRGPELQRGLIITRRGYADPALGADHRLRTLESGHPVPDQSSLDSGAALLAFAHGIETGREVICLISGGASSLVEVLPAGVGLAELERANRWLLASGLEIRSVNAVRRRLSRIKGGGLAAALSGHRVTACYISDVPGDNPADIGSGLLSPSAAALPGDLPDWLTAVLEPSPADVPAGGTVEHRVVADLGQALAACDKAARAAGFRVVRHETRLQGDPERASRRIVDAVDAVGAGPATVHLWGGETTPKLPPEPGRGGRNQHLALCCARRIAGRRGLSILCAATDGSDGNSSDAGGLVDGGTIARGEAAGLDPARSLARADAGVFLEASGDLISTGPTGTNVTDLVIGLNAGSR